MTEYVFDESWTGLLTAVFEHFERRDQVSRVVLASAYQPSMFGAARVIERDEQKAARVAAGLARHLDAADRRKLFCTFLSGLPDAANILFGLIVRIFSGETNIMDNYGDEAVLYVAQTAKSVERERHRMKAFIRFQQSADGMFFAVVEPDFNVLPLILSFFRSRYADQCWLIYDVRRRYGLYYDRQQVTEVYIDLQEVMPEAKSLATAFASEEGKYKLLWQDYFKSTNIAARKNMKLHLQHVPRRYWKYLTEKADALKAI